MMSVIKSIISLTLFFALILPSYSQQWLGPFIKEDAVNPILEPRNDTEFFCPVLQQSIKWESKDVFNPTAIIWQDQIHLLYRAEDAIGEFAGTSRIGHAVSDDGLHFERLPTPIFYPDNDTAFEYEWPGGCEDPRVVQSQDGTFVMTYTAYDGTLARLMVATSLDLQTWTKHGSAFKEAYGGRFVNEWSKSGSIITQFVERKGKNGVNQLAEAVKINGTYWMYYGDTNIFTSFSTDLINWTPLLDEDGVNLYKVFGPRQGKFDSDLVEPGPQAMLGPDGIYLIYNGRNAAESQGGDPSLHEGTYSAGQVILDSEIPYLVKYRMEEYFMTPDRPYEIDGQINFVVFLEGMVYHKGQLFIYYGTADSKIAVASMMDKKLLM